ncbi:hypothetical protein NA78x_002144 [Anatilimnocola sp. NA78]|uniref:hypothetical protein n=1 Tax=Anatilimnocola sp. NA78 TaxID=3415683 RepID=UPI003CE57D3F
MELIINHQRTIRNPDAKAIVRHLRALDQGEFAILSASDLTFIQTMNTAEDGFVVEYQTGSTDEHYAAANPPHDVEDVAAAFVAYAAGDDAWKTAFTWEHLQLTQADFMLVSAMTAGYLERDESPIEAADQMEMPAYGPQALVELAAILLNQPAEEIQDSFVVIAEIEPVGMDPAQLIPLPAEFQQALTQLSDAQATKIAKQWAASDGFPNSNTELADVAELLMELTALADRASKSKQELVISYFADQQLEE